MSTYIHLHKIFPEHYTLSITCYPIDVREQKPQQDRARPVAMIRRRDFKEHSSLI